MKLPKILVLSLIALLLFSGYAKAATNGVNCGLLPSSISGLVNAHAPWYCPINQQVYSQWVRYLPAAIIIVLVSFLIAAAIFMTGIALNSNRIKNYGIGEFYEAAATAIIVGMFLYVCAVMFGIIPSILVGTINPYASAFNLMSQTITSAQNLYTTIFNVYFPIEYYTSYQVTLQVNSLGNVAKWLLNLIGAAPQVLLQLYAIPATIYYSDPAIAIAKFLSDGLLALYAEYYLLVFFASAAIPAFLVPGVFFRALPPTRALGGILIAFGIGFYLIAPSLFAVAYYFTAPTLNSNMAAATLQMQKLSGSQSVGFTQGISQAASPTAPIAVQLQNVKSSINGFWLLILFYPALIAAITYASIAQLADFIGKSPARLGKIRSFV